MTAMHTVASLMWRPMMIMGVMLLGSGAIIAGVMRFMANRVREVASEALEADA